MLKNIFLFFLIVPSLITSEENSLEFLYEESMAEMEQHIKQYKNPEELESLIRMDNACKEQCQVFIESI